MDIAINNSEGEGLFAYYLVWRPLLELIKIK